MNSPQLSCAKDPSGWNGWSGSGNLTLSLWPALQPSGPPSHDLELGLAASPTGWLALSCGLYLTPAASTPTKRSQPLPLPTPSPPGQQGSSSERRSNQLPLLARCGGIRRSFNASSTNSAAPSPGSILSLEMISCRSDHRNKAVETPLPTALLHRIARRRVHFSPESARFWMC